MDSMHLVEPKRESTIDDDELHSVFIKEECSHYTIKSENMNFDEDMLEMESKIHPPDGNLESILKTNVEENITEHEEDIFNVKVEDVNEEDIEDFPEYIKSEELILNKEEKEVVFCSVTGNAVSIGVPGRAAKTVPKGTLELRPCPINGFGIYTLRHFQKGVQFGPYEGKLTKLASTEGYFWKLIKGRLLDEGDDTESNYLQYINCARNVSEQNLEAFQRKGEIYFRTCRDVIEGEELLIYFSNTSNNAYYKPREEFYGCQFEKPCRCTETGETNHQNSGTSPPLTPAPKKSRTKAERQREYRLRQKKLKEALNINRDKPPKKTRADYQREYRLRKKLKAKLNSGSAKMIPSQEAGPSQYPAPVTTPPLMSSSPDARPIII